MLIAHKGWVMKEGGGKSTFGRKNWKRRYLVLTATGLLSYFDSDAVSVVSLSCR